MATCRMSGECWKWAKVYLNDCICSRRDEVSFSLGLVSVLSWGVAEIPQIITNYKEKSVEGLSLGFLITWIIGDVFNLFDCILEPATLPTQYYMAVVRPFSTSRMLVYHIVLMFSTVDLHDLALGVVGKKMNGRVFFM
ncbi:hypothetical protein HRI_004475600 [Hibiscus trionum]|uniref:Uncharacterized protein n=1 Tax=Hibiscus trionum TaxID=183268 RepID=A0A9W7MMW5_HIBTR|nr:hypothetical protein HRI_004475600 [Hibiscus trionum]